MKLPRTQFSTSLAACVALVPALCFTGDGAAQNARAYTESPLPPPTGSYVTDNSNVIDAATKERLTAILNNLKERADIEFAVVTVPTTGGRRHLRLLARGGARLGHRLEGWREERAAPARRGRRPQVPARRSAATSKATCRTGSSGEIARQRLVPPFRQGDYGKGIADFVQTVVATLAQKRGFSVEGIDRVRLTGPCNAQRRRGARDAEQLRARRVLCHQHRRARRALAVRQGRGGRGGRGGWGGGGGGGGWPPRSSWRTRAAARRERAAAASAAAAGAAVEAVAAAASAASAAAAIRRRRLRRQAGRK